jgi:hypothetical protein
MRPDLRKVDKPIDLAKQVIVRNMTLEAKAIEQRLLHHPPFAHHRESPDSLRKLNPQRVIAASDCFNGIGGQRAYKGRLRNDPSSRQSRHSFASADYVSQPGSWSPQSPSIGIIRCPTRPAAVRLDQP